MQISWFNFLHIREVIFYWYENLQSQALRQNEKLNGLEEF